jgi:hypothetical protein
LEDKEPHPEDQIPWGELLWIERELKSEGETGWSRYRGLGSEGLQVFAKDYFDKNTLLAYRVGVLLQGEPAIRVMGWGYTEAAPRVRDGEFFSAAERQSRGDGINTKVFQDLGRSTEALKQLKEPSNQRTVLALADMAEIFPPIGLQDTVVKPPENLAAALQKAEKQNLLKALEAKTVVGWTQGQHFWFLAGLETSPVQVKIPLKETKIWNQWWPYLTEVKEPNLGSVHLTIDSGGQKFQVPLRVTFQETANGIQLHWKLDVPTPTPNPTPNPSPTKTKTKIPSPTPPQPPSMIAAYEGHITVVQPDQKRNWVVLACGQTVALKSTLFQKISESLAKRVWFQSAPALVDSLIRRSHNSKYLPKGDKNPDGSKVWDDWNPPANDGDSLVIPPKYHLLDLSTMPTRSSKT